MSGLKVYSLLFIIMLAVVACKKLINQPIVSTSNSYLVVNGSIMSGDTTTISLSRTVNVTGKVNSKPELDAIVNIEGSDGTVYNLTSKGNGDYFTAPLDLSAQTYRLNIITRDGKRYQSDFVPLKNSPPIDSINYHIIDTGVLIDVNTHDVNNKTWYYRWEYVETFVIHSEFASPLMHFTNPDTILARPVANQIDTCWQTDSSSTITLASSAKLSRDVISSQQLTNISSTSDKLGYDYSILVKQFALTQDAYNYLQLLKSNTEQLGSIFDAQPSQIKGNIHCLSDPGEQVIGFVTCGSISQKRIFISKKDIPQWTPTDKYGYCVIDTAYFINPQSQGHDVEVYLYSDFKMPLYTVYESAGSTKIIGYGSTLRACADCTVRGTNKRPAFWK